MSHEKFDEEYYRRFYENQQTCAVSPEEMAMRGRMIGLNIKLWGVTVDSILDVGCGLGLLREGLLAELPGATYTGVEVSSYLCQRMGWQQGSVESYETDEVYDLVICCDVVQYLGERAAARALNNLARWCNHILYFHVPSDRDWSDVADRSRSDSHVHFRPGDWYRSRLRRNFRHLGMGLHARRGLNVPQWDLEAPWV